MPDSIQQTNSASSDHCRTISASSPLASGLADREAEQIRPLDHVVELFTAPLVEQWRKANLILARWEAREVGGAMRGAGLISDALRPQVLTYH